MSMSNLIRDNKTFQIPNMIQTGKAAQMRLMDEAIVELLEAGKISLDSRLAGMTRHGMHLRIKEARIQRRFFTQ